jgi:hypothetical protein
MNDAYAHVMQVQGARLTPRVLHGSSGSSFGMFGYSANLNTR